ncbi:MAG: hypothetical protein RLZZ450_3094 [Pseudomonadota bacterium]|jgi:hypothetical protein
MQATPDADTTLIGCPLSWSRALRSNLVAPTGDLRAHACAWLHGHAWRFERGFGWRDPLDQDGWDLSWAIRLQALREAQQELEPRWELTAGSVGGFGQWIECVEVGRVDRPGFCTPAVALKREGLTRPRPVPRFAPRLALLQGGRTR